MDAEVDRLITALHPPDCSVLEVSGTAHADRGWKHYRSVQYPDFDLLAPEPIGEFDVVICEQVLEHVDDPWVASRTLRQLSRPGGHVLVSTPFMLKIHPSPADHWRFTPTGLREVLERADLEIVEIGSWGNSWCIAANSRRWAPYRWWHRVLSRWTLRNDHAVPQVVWALTRRPVGPSAGRPI